MKKATQQHPERISAHPPKLETLVWIARLKAAIYVELMAQILNEPVLSIDFRQYYLSIRIGVAKGG